MVSFGGGRSRNDCLCQTSPTRGGNRLAALRCGGLQALAASAGKIQERRVILYDSGTRGAIPPDATIAWDVRLMAKFKPVKAKKGRSAAPQSGLPCVILLILGFVLLLLFMYFVMKNAT